MGCTFFFFFAMGNPFEDHQPREGGCSRLVCGIQQAGVALPPRGSTSTTDDLEYPLKPLGVPSSALCQGCGKMIYTNSACPGRRGHIGPRPLPGGSIAPGVHQFNPGVGRFGTRPTGGEVSALGTRRAPISTALGR